MAISEQLKSPVRLLRSSFGHGIPYPSDALFVGHGSKWANPFKKTDVDALRGEPDVEAAYRAGGWKEAAKMLYVEHMREQGLDARELRGKDLVCTCRPGEPCHADVLLELANNDTPSTKVS
jgi:hypothetical protein